MDPQIHLTALQEQIAHFLPTLQWNYAEKNPAALATFTQRIEDTIRTRTTIAYSDMVKGVALTTHPGDGAVPNEGDAQPEAEPLPMNDEATEFLQHIALHSFVSKGTLDSAVVVEDPRGTSGRTFLLSVVLQLAETLGLWVNSNRLGERDFWEREIRIVYGDCPPAERRSVGAKDVLARGPRFLTPIEEQLQRHFEREEEFDLLLTHLRELDHMANAMFRNYGKTTDEREEVEQEKEVEQGEEASSPDEHSPKIENKPLKIKRLLAQQGVLLSEELFRTVSALAAPGQHVALARLAQEVENLEAMVQATSVVVSAIEMSAVIRLPANTMTSPIQGRSLVPSNLPLNAQLRSHAAALARFVSVGVLQSAKGAEVDRLGSLLSHETARMTRVLVDLARFQHENQLQRELIKGLLSTTYPDLLEYDVAFFAKRLGCTQQHVLTRIQDYENSPGKYGNFQRCPNGRQKIYTTDKRLAMHFEKWVCKNGRKLR